MRHIYRKNILRTIRQTLSRFGAIFAIVALGVGFLAGLLSTTPDMRYSGDKYFDDTKLYDLQVLGTLGLSDANVAAIRKTPGVADVMPAYKADLLLQLPAGDVAVTRIHSLPTALLDESDPAGYLNRLEVQQGRLPVRSGECVVTQTNLYGGGAVAVGDTLTVAPDNKNVDDTLAVTRFKVVGIVRSSAYFSVEHESASVGSGSVQLVMFIGDEDFAMSAYSGAYVLVQGAAAENALTDAYDDTVEAVQQQLKDIGGAQSAARLAEVKADAQSTLDDAKAEYETQKADAEKQLADAKQQLDDAKQQLADGESGLADAADEIADGQAQLDSGKDAYNAQMSAAQQQLDAAQTALDGGLAQYRSGLAQYNSGLAQYQQGVDFVNNYGPAIEAAHTALSGVSDPAAAEAQYAAAAQQAGTDYGTLAGALTADGSPQQLQSAEQRAYVQAAYALDMAMTQAGYTDAAAWQAADPTAAGPFIAARDAAKAAADAADPALVPAADAALAGARGTYLGAAGQLIQFKTLRALDAQYQTLVDTREGLPAAKTKLDAAKAQLDAAKQKLDAAAAQIAAGRAAMATSAQEALAKFAEADKTLADARAQYASGTQELADARTQYADGLAEYNDKKAEADKKLADAQKKIDDAQADIDALETPDWYVQTRAESNVSFASFQSNTQKVEAIAKVFPIFFFLVAALVALTTMTRMVEEERLQIGTMKALGYSSGTIMMKYVWYALTASVLGSVFGLAVGLWLFPTVIWNAYTMMYTLPQLHCLFLPQYALAAAFAAIACTLLATFSACRATLAECPARLMLPRAPKAGKRILLERVGFLWKRLSFTQKVTARNLFRYKKRFFMTVIGIAGCTALLVTGFGLHDSISDIVNNQFGRIFTYDLTVAAKKEAALQTGGSLCEILDDKTAVSAWMPVHQEQSDNTYSGVKFSTYIFVPEDSQRLSEFVTLRQRLSGESVPFEPDRGIVITEKMSERTGYGVGDTIPLTNADGETGQFLITGVAENYVQNYVYMDAALYEQQFGSAPAFDLAVARVADHSAAARDTLSARLLDVQDTAAISFIDDLKDTFSNMMAKIDTIVVVLIISAGLLAFVVLYNLTNINITERVKEIATLKVLGFYDRETNAYIFRESVALSLIGTLAGLVLGIFLHRFVIYNVEVDAVMFGRTIKALSYVYAAALTMVFSLLVNLVMRRHLRRISMVESMKAPE